MSNSKVQAGAFIGRVLTRYRTTANWREAKDRSRPFSDVQPAAVRDLSVAGSRVPQVEGETSGTRLMNVAFLQPALTGLALMENTLHRLGPLIFTTASAGVWAMIIIGAALLAK